jgi:uridine kinase
MPILILIAGGTCCGKTTIARQLGKRLPEGESLIFSHDNYYHDLGHLQDDEIDKYNFDIPDAINAKQLVADIRTLLAEKSITLPRYDFIAHRRTDGINISSPKTLIILEGIFTLHFPELLALADLKIFVETASDIRLVRRIQRDTHERNFTLDGVLRQYLSTVKPMHETFVEPTRANADIIIPGDRSFEIALRMIDGFLERELRLADKDEG